MSDTLAELQEALEAAIGNRDNIVRYNTDPYNGTVDSPIETNEAEIQGLEILIAQAEKESGEQSLYDDGEEEEEEEAPAQASSDEIGKDAMSGLGGPRNFFGGNFDVYSALEKVEFQGAAGDSSLRGNVAYIRMWKRGSTAQAASTSEAPGEVSPASDEQQILQDDLEAAIGERDNVANNYDPRIGEYDYNPYGDDVDNPIEIAEANVQIADNRIAQTKQQSVGTQTPTSSTPTQASSTNVVSPPSPSPSPNTSGPALGPVKSANPNGSMGSLAKVGSALIGLPASSPTYSGNAVKGPGGSAAGQSGDVMWQFLFNPSEIELEAGPEFKNAETWGVSDKANSGQPLHWSHNKNAQLKFNSVLLNGFVFGRKVEKLEQGLIELFMARKGDGQDGPHVLEFVWGKRVFGPCVIKGVNVKEKMWDEGEVVNAEVSFTLEQVPEWTINDGFVDVARPGKLGVEGNVTGPTASTPTSSTSTTSSTPPAAAARAGKPDQKAATAAQPEDFVGCKNLQQLKLNAIAFNPSPGSYERIIDFSFSDRFAINSSSDSNRGPYKTNFSRNMNNYVVFVAKGTNLGVSSSSKCLPIAIKLEHARLTKNSNDSLKEAADKQMASFMNSCAAELGSKAGVFFDQKSCERFTDPKKPNQPI